MTQGTTPTLCIKCAGVDVGDFSSVYVTLAQGGVSVTKSGADVAVNADSNTVSVTLTQAETLGFSPASPAFMQVRAMLGDSAVASSVMIVPVSAVLYEGVIS